MVQNYQPSIYIQRMTQSEELDVINPIGKDWV